MHFFIFELLVICVISAHCMSINRQEEDTDLEDSAIDYYDNVLEYLKNILKISSEKVDNFPDYDYMSDMPSPEIPKSVQELIELNGTWQYVNTSLDDPMLVKVDRERSKELRLTTIKKTILELRGTALPFANASIEIPTTKTLREIFSNNKNLIPNKSGTSFTEKVQSFYPSCDTPRATDDDLWKDNSNMNLFFEITFPNPSEEAVISIVSAKLRLYKVSYFNESLPTPSPNNPLDKTSIDSHGVLSRRGSSPLEDDRFVRVSVYWYTRALRRTKSKRKLLDSHMFSVTGEEWTEFNIRTAVRIWHEVGKNYGLLVTVEDEDGAVLPANQYIHPMNCSTASGNMRPLPSIIYDAAHKYMKSHHQISGNQSYPNVHNFSEMGSFPYPAPYPIVDLYTMEIPLAEASSYPEFMVPKRSSSLNSSLLLGTKQDISNSANTTGVVKSNYFTNVGIGTVNVSGQQTSLSTTDSVTRTNDLLRGQNIETPRLRHSRKQESSARNEPI